MEEVHDSWLSGMSEVTNINKINMTSMQNWNLQGLQCFTRIWMIIDKLTESAVFLLMFFHSGDIVVPLSWNKTLANVPPAVVACRIGRFGSLVHRLMSCVAQHLASTTRNSERKFSQLITRSVGQFTLVIPYYWKSPFQIFFGSEVSTPVPCFLSSKEENSFHQGKWEPG